jgi:hypothetical protein
LDETVYKAAIPTFELAATGVTLTAGSTTGNTSTITITPDSGFTGGVTLTAAIADSPIGAKNLPALAFASNGSVNVGGSGPETTTLTITTKANPATSAANERGSAHLYASGGMTLACLLLFGIPARRRRYWQSLLGVVVLLAALATGAVGCSGGLVLNNASSSTGTTPGIYLITVKGASGSTTASTTVSLTVQ